MIKAKLHTTTTAPNGSLERAFVWACPVCHSNNAEIGRTNTKRYPKTGFKACRWCGAVAQVEIPFAEAPKPQEPNPMKQYQPDWLRAAATTPFGPASFAATRGVAPGEADVKVEGGNCTCLHQFKHTRSEGNPPDPRRIWHFKCVVCGAELEVRAQVG
jgi:transcription elongation factor Elf1